MTSVDLFANANTGLTAPYTHAAALTTSDSADLAYVSRALVVGVGGTVKVDMLGGETGVTLTLPAGVWPLRVSRVYATGTAATNIAALW